MLFPTVAAVSSQPMSLTEEKARQILVVGTSDSRSLNQKRQAPELSQMKAYMRTYLNLWLMGYQNSCELTPLRRR